MQRPMNGLAKIEAMVQIARMVSICSPMGERAIGVILMNLNHTVNKNRNKY